MKSLAVGDPVERDRKLKLKAFFDKLDQSSGLTTEYLKTQLARRRRNQVLASQKSALSGALVKRRSHLRQETRPGTTNEGAARPVVKPKLHVALTDTQTQVLR